MDDKYTQALHQAQEELAGLEQRRAALLRLVEDLKVLSENNAYELTPPPGYVPKGLTDEIRTVLNLTTVHLDAVQIRDALLARGFKASSPKNLLINVHTVLGRIEQELDVIEREGKSAYKTKASSVAAATAALSALGLTEDAGKAVASLAHLATLSDLAGNLRGPFGRRMAPKSEVSKDKK